ncbi:MAG TPA: NHLP bacteriocin system secretion protein [Xanthomonadaceae bacterium]|nr:NHLP bacteriocin system secretion protein [Xanthomonadaceae bacterium]
MSEERQDTFGKQALERMSSPDRLDQLIRIVYLQDWLVLAALLTIAVFGLAWCIWGQLPTTVSGEGMIVRPRKVVDIQSQAAGKLVNFNLRVGDEVKKGDVLGVIDQSLIRRQLEEDRTRLATLEEEDRKENELQKKQSQLQGRDFEERKRDLQAQIATRDEGISNGETLRGVLKKRLDAVNEAINLGIEPKVSADLLQTEKEYLENESHLSELQAQRGDLQSQIKEIETRRTELSRTLLQASSGRKNQILELRRNIGVGQVELEINTRVVSEYPGRVVEISGTQGQAVSAGSRLASVELQKAGEDLVCVTYFPVGEGKQIRLGMKIQVTPDNVKRERFGGILGKVAAVSSFPVTKEGASVLLGNPEVAERMLRDEPRIEVMVDLERDPTTYSGYRWSSSPGPRLPVSAGTTTRGRVTVEMRSPITYLLPFLRGMSGVN